MSVVAAGVLAWKPVAAEILSLRLARAMEQVRVVAAISQSGARLSGPTASSNFAQAQPQKRDRTSVLASRLSNLARQTSGDTAARAKGVAHYVAGDCKFAVGAFESIRQRDARDWNDVAAATICVAQKETRADRWLAALTMADRALSADPSFPEAQSNRALVLDALGIRVRAATQSELDLWKTATGDLTNVEADQLASLTRTYPESARRYAETVYVARWADAVRNGKNDVAKKLFEQIRVIAQVLERETGETLLADVIRRIERDGRPQSALLDGLTAYYEGRVRYSQYDYAGSETKLSEAETLLTRAGCPLAKMAEFYRVSAIGDQGQTLEAQRQFSERVDAERAAGTPHKALLAHTLYQFSLGEAILGHWSASLAAATESLATFSALRERQNAAAVYAVLAEDLEFVGQQERSLSQGVTGLRATCAAGDYERARVMLATLCRTKTRAGEAAPALSLTSLEWEIAPLASDPRLDADMFLRRASAQWHLGKIADATRSLQLARDAATQAPDGALRAKLSADVDATEGAFLRRRDPDRAVTLLSSAIEFQRNASRPIILPELYLQRGRAYLAVNEPDAAERDFEAGLSELERQRTRVNEAELRPGIFDDASALFDEAIALQIRKHADADAVLRQVERGRARAVLEQLDATAALPRIADIRHVLDAGTALIEYVALPDRLIAFVITRDGATMKSIPITREKLRTTAHSFTDRHGAGGGELYDILIAPIQNELKGVSALNIVADDFLQRIPFGALFDRKTQTFLVQHASSATSPSAGVFVATRVRTQRLPSRPTTALVFANPTSDLPSLSASEYEAPRIARSYPHAEVFTGDAATAARFRELAPSRDVVSFAGHGVINEREPYSSALVCAAGRVTSRDIARMKFRSTRVVVLAACSTLAGRNAAVEGVPSLARAFVVAGVPAVVGTLWDIEDSEAPAITRPLHERLARGDTPADALRFAQLAAIRKQSPPSQWSAFALMGSASAAPD